MCGFSGFLSSASMCSDVEAMLEEMGKAISTRGPDSSGRWYDEQHGVGLSHVRLAVMDLSPAGHQPMVSDCNRYVIAFNGEIYNHFEIRDEINLLENVRWNGHSDTETLLKSIQVWGLKDALKRCQGMFALALYDKESENLYLARDRLGEKPLYYGWQSGVFLFGSQLNAIRQHPSFEADIDRDSLTLLLRHNYIPAPYSIYRGIKKLLPGEILKTRKDAEIYEIEAYWDARLDVFSRKKETVDEVRLVDDLEATLRASIKSQMISDVPLGAFLSGGVDSSTIVALMQSLSDVPVKTFSIGFYEKGYNEAEHAKAIAEHLGTDHTELYVTAEEALKVVPKLANLYDEPFSDSSQIPTYIVSEMARRYVTVSLSGDGGDELYCGYNRYILTDKLWRRLFKVPLFIRRMTAKAITLLPPSSWNLVGNLIPRRHRLNKLGDKLHKAAGVLCATTSEELYLGLVSHWRNPERVVIKSKEPSTVITDPARTPKIDDPIEKMMAIDMLSYLPDDILVKVDRAAMGVSLETRVPFLNHKVVEQAWTIPMKTKLKSGEGKHCLKEVLYRYVPRELMERPKMGFGVPIGEWLRGPLQEWAAKLLDKNRIIEEGFFEATIVSEMWDQHLSGDRDWQYQLWDILMFQAWYEAYHK